MKDYAVYFRLLKNLATFKEFDHSRVIPITIEKYYKLEESENIENPLSNYIDEYDNIITIGLIRYLINNERYFLERLYKDATPIIEINTIERDVSCDFVMSFSKADFIMRIEQAHQNGLLSEEEYQKTSKIRSAVQYEQLLEEFNDQTMYFTCHSGQYEIPVMNYFNILKLEKEELAKILDDWPTSSIPKEEFIASMKSFFLMSGIFERYIVPKKMISNKYYLESKVDTYAASTSFQPLPEYVSEIKLNESLTTKILSSIPSEFTNLEKAYYVYYQLCKTFTYDEEWYASGGLGDNCQNHKNIDYISQINQTNREVVCHDFNAIYSKFLELLGIKYKYPAIREYASGHAYLEFATDKFYVSADAVTSILSGDLPNAKLGRKLVGFKLKNTNVKTKEEFAKSIQKVEEYIKKEEDKVQDFYSAVEEYNSKKFPSECLSLGERLNIFFGAVTSSNLPVTDSLTYIHTLEKNLFPSTDGQHCKSYFVANHLPSAERNKSATVVVITCFNEEDINTSSESNIYYTYFPNDGFYEAPKEQLERAFQTGRYSIISNYIDEIPGLNIKPPKETNIHK